MPDGIVSRSMARMRISSRGTGGLRTRRDDSIDGRLGTGIRHRETTGRHQSNHSIGSQLIILTFSRVHAVVPGSVV